MRGSTINKKVWAWAAYDWANSAFATTVMAGLFPVFFKEYWSVGADVTVSTYRLGIANSTAGVIIAVLAPVLGAVADQGGTKKKFLLFFAAMGVVMTGGMYFVARGDWQIAVGLYVLATVGFSGGNIFYDSLLVGVAPPGRTDFVSALGFAMGYLGGGLLFAGNILMVQHPAWFGLADRAMAVKVSFVTVAFWWAAFSVPLFLFVDEPRVIGVRSGRSTVRAGLARLAGTFREIRKLRVVFLFLVAYWLYIDGVDTIIRMAVDYGLSLGLEPGSLIKALLITQFVGFPAAIIFGKLGEKLGAKTGIFCGIGVYIGVTVWGFFLRSTWEFYALAVVIGMVQGGVQALSRSLYSRLIPPDRAAEFFGFYNMLGKFAVVIGPVLMGTVGRLTGSTRFSILAVVVLFIGGGAVLYFVDEDRAAPGGSA